MQIRSVPPDDVALTRVVEEGWVAYCESAVSAMRYTISTTAIDEYLRDHLDSSAGTLWVLLDDPDNRGTPIGRVDATLAGFILTARHEAPQKFDWPDQLEIRDLWVPRAYRGATAAAALVDRAIQQAREYGYRRLTVRVDVGNEQGRSFFGSLGLEPRGYRMHAPIADVKLDTNERIRDRPSLHLRRVRPDPAVLQRFVEVCWVPFWRALEGAVDADHLRSDFDRDRVVEQLCEEYDAPDRRCWVVLEDPNDPLAPLERVDATFAGWVQVGAATRPSFRAAPARLFLGNLFVESEYRGSGLADLLMDRVREHAREDGCAELALDVELANDRAMAYYEELGFDPVEVRLNGPIAEIDS